MPKKGTPTGSRRRINAADKDQILALFNEGLGQAEISRQLDIHGHVVNGVIQTAKKRGALGTIPPSSSSPPPKENPPMSERAPQIQTQSVPQSSSQADGFSGGRPIVGGSGGFSNTSTAVKYTVERTVPPDGLLGTHYGSFSVDELGRIYGSGTYKVTKHEPGRAVPTEYVQTIAASFGEPKFPNAAGERRPRGYRPWQGRANERDQEHDDDDRSRTAARPYWHGYYQRDRGQEEGQRDSRLYDFARHTSSASEGAMGKMVEQMDRMHQRSMDELKDARKGGPDNFVREFFEKQQQSMNTRFEEERKVAEERRQQEEEKWERRQKEDRDAWQRRQDEEDKKHQRELERMKTEALTRLQEKEKEEERRQKREAEERKFLLDLEEKRLKIVQEEAKSQRERLESELKKASTSMEKMQEKVSAEIKEAREGAAEAIQEAQEKQEERRKEREEQLEREHKLKEKHLDNEYKLQGQILDIKKEGLESSGGDQLFTTINTVIKEFSKGLEKIVDLKKIEAMTPEAQAAAVAKGSIDGNVLGDPPRSQADAQRQAAAQAQRQAEAQGAQRPTGNGGSHSAEPHQAAPAAEPENGETKMDSIIQQNLKNPIFREVIKEWALHVQSGSDATTFANLYLEMMRDPQNDEGRKACAAFATYMKPRNWEMMLKALTPSLEPDIVKTFQLPQAEEFYEAFRAMVVEQIRDYWEQFIAARKAQQQQQPAAQAPQAAPSQEAEDPGVPVPTRESLRAQVEETQ